MPYFCPDIVERFTPEHYRHPGTATGAVPGEDTFAVARTSLTDRWRVWLKRQAGTAAHVHLHGSGASVSDPGALLRY
eukprot:4791317-Alexandrium_andersonii.AAC.1